VTWPSIKPAYSLECFCVDCYQKNEHFAKVSGAPIPDDFTKHAKMPMLLSYWPAKMLISGKENLTFNKLRGDSSSINCCTKCCDTLLFVDNPFYDGKVVLTMPQFRPIESDAEFDLPGGRVFIKDWPAQDYEVYVRSSGTVLPTMYIDRQRGATVPTFEGDWAFSKAGKDTAGMLIDSVEGETFAALLAAGGGEINVLDLPELGNSARCVPCAEPP